MRSAVPLPHPGTGPLPLRQPRSTTPVETSPMKLPTFLLLSLLPCALAAAPPQDPAAPAADAPASTHVMVKAAEVTWGDPPPAFERGAQAAVMAGNPGEAGVFTIRLKTPAGYRIARHWHPTDEHVTVIEGDLTLEMGEGDQMHSATFGPGDYVLLPAKMHHAASTKGGMVVQVHGTGPFELSYVDPKDDPRKRAPAAEEKSE